MTGKTLTQTGSNWGDSVEAKPQNEKGGGQPSQQFDVWLGQNKLSNASEESLLLKKLDDEGKDRAGEGKSAGYGGRASKSSGEQSKKPSAAQVAQGKNKRELSESSSQQNWNYNDGVGNVDKNGPADEKQRELRYRERVAQQQSVQTWSNNDFSGNQSINAPSFNAQNPNQPPAMPPGGQPPVMTPQMPANPSVPARDDAALQVLASPRPQAAHSMLENASEGYFEGQQPATQAGVGVLPPATGMASLDIKLPIPDESRWSVYCFTTPRGETEITARPISGNLLRRLGYAAGAIAAIAILGFLIRRMFRGGCEWRLKPLTTTLIIVFGLLSLILGVLPLLGLLAIMAGLALKFVSPRQTAI